MSDMPKPVAWMVERDSHDCPEFFADSESARKNACMGMVGTKITPLYPLPPQAAAVPARQDAVPDASILKDAVDLLERLRDDINPDNTDTLHEIESIQFRYRTINEA